jgi:small conductance mechanosensitive channel
VPEPGSFARLLLSVDGWLLLTYQVGPSALRAVLIAIGTWIAVVLVRHSIRLVPSRTDVNARRLIGRIANTVIIGLGIATILDTVGVPLTTFVTVIGVAGLGISLAMQDVLKSFVAGTFLLFERPFRIGDEISVKDQRGVVEDIAFRTTRLRTPENVQVIIPNAVVFAEVVANRTNEVKPPPPEPDADADADAADHEGQATDQASAETPSAAAASSGAIPAPTPVPTTTPRP